MIQNPALPGYHPNLSMICVDGTFYVADSTFEYFPGVRISASRNFANRECVSTPVDDPRLDVSVERITTPAGSLEWVTTVQPFGVTLLEIGTLGC